MIYKLTRNSIFTSFWIVNTLRFWKATGEGYSYKLHVLIVFNTAPNTNLKLERKSQNRNTFVHGELTGIYRQMDLDKDKKEIQ